MECPRCFFDLPVETEDTVCPNCGRSYSYTANIYLGLLALAQLILAWSVRYLLTLEISPLTKPAGELADWCIWPVSIIDVPAQIPVLGGLLALLAVAPILTAILFGKRGGWLLAVITFALGPSMIFGAVLMLSSWIAGGRTCRMRSKLVSGLTALLPVIIYWFVSSIPPENLPLARALHGAVYVPAFFATLISVALVSALVVVGRLTRFDVRASVLPTVALMAGGIIAFLSFVGREEIEIATLDRDFGFEEYLIIDRGVSRLPADVRVRLEKYSSEFPKARRAGEVAYVLASDLDAASRGPDGQLRPDMREAAVGRWRKLVGSSPQCRFAIDARLALGRIHAPEGRTKTARPFYVAATDSCKDLKAPGGDLLSDFSLLTGLWSIGERLRARRSIQYRLDRCARGWR
ncbi:MAG: hypothetical protein QF662_06005, partial [Phycisphaerae bacterium]|nr:hypothetical protein [Phycisphaerae bacterium]